MTPKHYTNKLTGWTRTSFADGSSRWRIVPTDGSGERVVRRFLSAHSWQNDPADSRARVDEDRVVLLDGPALPEWAVGWLDVANRKATSQSRQALRNAIDDADDAPFRDTGW